MGDDSIDMVISHIDMGWFVTLPPAWRQSEPMNSEESNGSRRSTLEQGLTLVHSSAQLKRLQCDRGCSQGLFRGCLGGGRGY